jgi:hypothetical protein
MSMPAARGARELVVQILCSPAGLAGQASCMKAHDGKEGVNAEGQQSWYDYVSPPHDNHLNSATLFAFPRQEASYHGVDHIRSRPLPGQPMGHARARYQVISEHSRSTADCRMFMASTRVPARQRRPPLLLGTHEYNTLNVVLLISGAKKLRIPWMMRSPRRWSGASPFARDEVLCPEVAAWSGVASATKRATGPRDRVEVDAHLRTRGLRQDDAAH